MTKRLLTFLFRARGLDQSVRKNRHKQGQPEAQGRGSPISPTDLSNIIHRLSRPLTALRGSLELRLLTEGDAADYRLALKEAFAQAEDLVHLLSSLRELVDAEHSGDFKLVALAELVRAAGQEMQPLADSRGLTFDLELKADPYVLAYPRWLRLGGYRIMYHAVDRSRDLGTVSICLLRSGRTASLLISDEGPPVPHAELDLLSRTQSLGQLFSQSSKQSTLEWAIAKRIFEAQGGTVRVESRTGGGCCFQVYLPLAPS